MQTGPEQVLVEDWCLQYSSHAGGGLEFGGRLPLRDRGEGASFRFWDYGQDGDPNNSWHPINPCGGTPAGVDGVETPPTAQAGAAKRTSARRAIRRRPERLPDQDRPEHRLGRSRHGFANPPAPTCAACSRTACEIRSEWRSGPEPTSSSATSGIGFLDEIGRMAFADRSDAQLRLALLRGRARRGR